MTRKKTRRRAVPVIADPVRHAILGAAVTDTKALDKLRLIELSAIESFRTGSASRRDWMACADFLNLSETLARDGVGPEALAPCLKAQEALGAAKDRQGESGRLEATPAELDALRDAFAFFDLQRSSISRSRFETAIRTTINRIRSAHPSVKVYA